MFDDGLIRWLTYIFSSERLGSATGFIGGAATTYVLFSAHLAVIPASTRRHRRVWALGGTSLLLGLASLVSYSGPEDLVAEIPVRVPIKAPRSTIILPGTASASLGGGPR